MLCQGSGSLCRAAEVNSTVAVGKTDEATNAAFQFVLGLRCLAVSLVTRVLILHLHPQGKYGSG